MSNSCTFPCISYCVSCGCRKRKEEKEGYHGRWEEATTCEQTRVSGEGSIKGSALEDETIQKNSRTACTGSFIGDAPRSHERKGDSLACGSHSFSTNRYRLSLKSF